MWVCIVTGDVNLDCLFKVVSARFLHVKFLLLLYSLIILREML